MLTVPVEAIAHAAHLAADIGHRPAGSRENEAAAEYIENVFQNSGLTVGRQCFDCTWWEHDGTLIEVDGVAYAGEANWRSLPCNVTGTVMPVGSLEMLEKAKLSGNIALLYGELTQEELAPRLARVYYPPHHEKINRLLDHKRPLAVIMVSPLLHSIRHVIKDPGMEIPSASVMPQVGLELVKQAGKKLHLKINSRRFPGQAWNVLGVRSGERSERIVVSAHYDTVWGAPGAFDNASGVSVMLCLAQALSEKKLPVSFEFYASNGEEFGGGGALAYLQRYGLEEIPFRQDLPAGERHEVWDPILANINIDGVGLALGSNNVTVLAASQALADMVEAIRKEKYPGIVPTAPWPASDHYTFYSHGVPSIALGCTGGVANHLHQPVDTLEWLSPQKLDEDVQFVLDIIAALADKTPAWCRQKSA